MTKLFYILFIIGALILAPQARAQQVSPWFRGGPIAWEKALNSSFTASRVAQLPLLQPLCQHYTGYSVKSTVPNWISFRLLHSNTLSRMEKKILATHTANELATLGKLTFFYDRDALLQHHLPAENYHSEAFAHHQQLFSLTLSEAEHFFAQHSEELFAYSWLSKEHVQALLKSTAQPPSFILFSKEINVFPTLSLPEQKAYARDEIISAQQTLLRLLQTPPQLLQTSDFGLYYRAKLRLRYFSLVSQTLRQAESPRNTLIIRIYEQIPLDFLPESNALLTDAQRLGKLYFYKDKAIFPEQQVLLLAEISRQQSLYEYYAYAEAFQRPYEDLLKTLRAPTSVVFENDPLLTNWSAARVYQQIPVLIAELDRQMAQLRSTDHPTKSDFINYFRLHIRKAFYQSLRSQAHLELMFHHE